MHNHRLTIAAALLASISLLTACAAACIAAHCRTAVATATAPEHHHSEPSNPAREPSNSPPSLPDCAKGCPAEFVMSASASRVAFGDAVSLAAAAVVPVEAPSFMRVEFLAKASSSSQGLAPPGLYLALRI